MTKNFRRMLLWVPIRYNDKQPLWCAVMGLNINASTLDGDKAKAGERAQENKKIFHMGEDRVLNITVICAPSWWRQIGNATYLQRY